MKTNEKEKILENGQIIETKNENKFSKRIIVGINWKKRKETTRKCTEKWNIK